MPTWDAAFAEDTGTVENTFAGISGYEHKGRNNDAVAMMKDLDRNGDGYLDPEELKRAGEAASRALEIKKQRAQVKRESEYAELRNYLAVNVRTGAQSVTNAKAFLLGVRDEDGDGKLDKHEFTRALFDELDVDKSGTLDKTEFKFDVDHVDPDGFGATMLHYAARAGRYDVVRFLVSCDADLNIRDYNDESPLMQARANGHSEVVEYLLNPVKDVIMIDRPDMDDAPKVRTGSRPFPYYKIHPDAPPIPFPGKCVDPPPPPKTASDFWSVGALTADGEHKGVHMQYEQGKW